MRVFLRVNKMAYRLFSNLPPQFLDSNGAPLSGGTLTFSLTDTDTATPIYSDEDGTAASNPLTLDARGEITTTKNVWGNESVKYRVTLKDSGGSTIWAQDDVRVGGANAGDNWATQTHSPTYQTASAFSLAVANGDQSAEYHPGRNVRLNSNTYATVLSSNYNSTVANATHVTLYWVHDTDNVTANVPNPLTSVELGPEVNKPALNLGFRYLRQFGAVPSNGESGYFDNLAIFNKALSAAYAERKSLVIDGIHSSGSKAYAISDTWSIGSSYSGINIVGEGQSSSLILNMATDGSAAIQVDGATHVNISDIGIQGLTGGGHGLELLNIADHFVGTRIWVGWVDGDGVRVTKAQQCSWLSCSIDINNGWRPCVIDASLTEGNVRNGIYIIGDAGNLNNDHSFHGCKVNGAQQTSASTDYGVKIGDSTARVDSIKWFGGLIQASAAYQQAYVRGKDCWFFDPHFEPPVGATSNYILTFDNCSSAGVIGGSIQGDVLITDTNGACDNVHINGVTMAGADIAATTRHSSIVNSSYKNISTGPTGGDIIDKSALLIRKNLRNANDDDFEHCINLTNPQKFFSTNMNDWIGGASPSNPAGLGAQSGATIARETVEGTATSGTSTTLVDSGQTWETDVHIGAKIVCTGGTGAGQAETITDSDGTSVTVASWTTATPDATTTYRIVGSTVRTGPYSMKATYSADYNQGHSVNFPIDKVAGEKIAFRAVVYVSSGEAAIVANLNSNPVAYVSSQTTGQQEVIEGTINIGDSIRSVNLLLTGTNTSIVYWDSLEIYINDWSPVEFASIADSATPDVTVSTNNNGPMISTVRLLGTTSLTNIVGMEYGKPLHIIFDGSKTVPDSGNFALAGAYNATAGDTLTVVRDPSDDVIYELNRSVN